MTINWSEPKGEFRKIFIMRMTHSPQYNLGPHWRYIPKRWECVEDEREVEYASIGPAKFVIWDIKGRRYLQYKGKKYKGKIAR